MNRSRLWLAFGSALSVGLGFVSGMMYTRSSAAGVSDAIGRLYEIDGDAYIDSALVAFLTQRAELRRTIPCSTVLPCPGEWTALHFRAVVVFVKKLSERPILPRQLGGLYSVRRLSGDSAEARGDRDVEKFLQEMIDLGLVDRVGRWKSWGDVLKDPHPGRGP
ncbi:MAG: hypothetical protein JNL82_36465 [Myxococcales bacterium]|nr:hypothetical protein [Myxococcales bacterium]